MPRASFPWRSPAGDPIGPSLNDISLTYRSARHREAIMGDSFTGGFGTTGFGLGGTAQSIWDAFDQLRSTFEQKMTPRMARGDVRAAVLALLAERPMHGYQIISEIEQRSGGAWKPSAGSVYPTLQLLADEGLIVSDVADGRKTYSLTEAGEAEVAATAGRAAPWESSAPRDPLGLGPLPKAGIDLAQATSAGLARRATAAAGAWQCATWRRSGGSSSYSGGLGSRASPPVGPPPACPASRSALTCSPSISAG